MFNPSFNRREDKTASLHLSRILYKNPHPEPPAKKKKMAPPKRALFSLNLDTDADHVYQRVEDHSKPSDERIKVLETKGATHGHTDLSFVTKPFEKTVNRAVENVLDGKKVVSKEGEITYSTTSSGTTRSKGRVTRNDEDDPSSDHEPSNLNIVSKSKRRSLEKKYDTSEL